MAYPLNGIFINSVLSTYCNKMVLGELRHAVDLMASSEHQPLVFDTYLYLKGFFYQGYNKTRSSWRSGASALSSQSLQSTSLAESLHQEAVVVCQVCLLKVLEQNRAA